MIDVLYYQRSAGSFEAWTYSDGSTVYLFNRAPIDRIRNYANHYGYRLVFVSPNP